MFFFSKIRTRGPSEVVQCDGKRIWTTFDYNFFFYNRLNLDVGISHLFDLHGSIYFDSTKIRKKKPRGHFCHYLFRSYRILTTIPVYRNIFTEFRSESVFFFFPPRPVQISMKFRSIAYRLDRTKGLSSVCSTDSDFCRGRRVPKFRTLANGPSAFDFPYCERKSKRIFIKYLLFFFLINSSGGI